MATKSQLTAEEAADLLGIDVGELLHQRARGLPPGNLGHRDDGRTLVWNRKDLKVPKPKAAAKPKTAAKPKAEKPQEAAPGVEATQAS